jgi:hypothetical protein
MKKTLSFILILVYLISCKNNNKVIHEDIINLYPDKELIKKQYYKYSLFDPFFPNDSIYSPIEPRKNNQKMGKTLIKATEPYNTGELKRYIIAKLNGKYSSYISENNTLLYRYYFRHFEDDEFREFNSSKKIENYFVNNNIKYKLIKQKDKTSVYILNRKENLPSSLCVVEFEDTNINVHITYDINDTIRHLAPKSLIPFRGSEIEN